MAEEERRRIEVNWVQSTAAALAAVTSAALLSTVGVAGTLIGAALGSIAVTLGSAVYSYYLSVTRDRVARAQTLAANRIGKASTRVRVASHSVAAGAPGAREELAEAGEELHRAQVLDDDREPPPPPVGGKAVLAGLPWKRIVLSAVGIFVAAMLVIVLFELVTGRALSSYTGGSDTGQRTSIPGLGGQAQPQAPGEAPAEAPSDGPTPSPEPEPTPSAGVAETTEPTDAAEPSARSTPSAPSSPTPTPTATATAKPTPTPAATATRGSSP